MLEVLDNKGHRVPNGCEGELYLSGPCLSLGYFNDSTSHNNQFFVNPFHADADHSKLYRTGDLVRVGTDGLLYFLGRVDEQIKIQGFRVSLNLIEEALKQHGNIQEACVLRSNDELNAYLTLCGDNHHLSFDELSLFLSEQFPHYMLPMKYSVLPRFPLTDRGKIDKSKLKDSPQVDLVGFHTEGSTDELSIEKRISRLCESLFKQKICDYSINFFDLGASSLGLFEVCERINQEFGINLDITTLLEYPSISRLGKYVEQYLMSSY